MKQKLSLFFIAALFIAAGASAQAKRGVTAGSLSRGQVVYKSVCLACHMANGSGVPRLNPPLANTSYVLGNKAALIKIVLNGFNEDVKINGQSYSNTMTPHSELTDQQIADVLTYVRKSFGNNASSVTVADVKKARKS